jgi:hypothetical protein
MLRIFANEYSAFLQKYLAYLWIMSYFILM